MKFVFYIPGLNAKGEKIKLKFLSLEMQKVNITTDRA